MAHGVGLLWDLVGRDNASPAFLRVAAAADKAATSTARSTTMLKRSAAAGASLTRKLALPLAVVAAVSVTQAAKYEKSLNTIRVATDQTVSQMAQASVGLKKINADTGAGLHGLTDAYYVAAKGGYNVAKSLKIVDAASKGAAAESADLGVVANALTSVLASYGKQLGSPVTAMNLIIRGAGLAKTSLQDFSASLANVVPVAASLKIKVADVFAAIATMTQHGETAQRATENLRNLITNLAGQNAVASSAMQQLGVNTVNLTQHLGKRGLVGSLDYVLARIAKFRGKDGTVVVDAFKQSALASKSLNSELATMTGQLKTQSQAFATGKLGQKDYLAFVRSLGGSDFARGKQFAGLVASSKGFSDLLRTGRGNVLSYATALQKVFGGIPGMNVALQLSGESSKFFHGAATNIARDAKNAGDKVLGWAETQKTAAVRTARLKSEVENLSVNFGTALLPAVTKVISGVTRAVQWFNGLSSSQKKLIGYTVLVVAALGPLITIVTRVGMAFKAMWLIGLAPVRFIAGMRAATISMTGMQSAAYLNGRAMAGWSTQARVLSGALAGAGIGSVVGALTRTSSTAVKVGGLVASVGAGAAVGWSMGGPWGAAFGGLMGGIGNLITGWGDNGKAAQRASELAQAGLEAQRSTAANLLSTLQSVNGAYVKQAKATVLSELTKTDKSGKSILQQAQAGGVDVRMLTTKLLQGTALTWINALWNTRKWKGTRDAFDDLAASLGGIQDGAAGAEQTFELFKRAQGSTVVSAKALAKGVANVKNELKGTGTQLQYTSRYLTIKNDKQVWATRLVNADSASAARNNAIIRDNVTHLKAQAIWAVAHGKSAATATATYGQRLASLRSILVHTLGFNATQVDGLLDKWKKLNLAKADPKVEPKGLTSAMANAKALQQTLDYLSGKNITAYINAVLRSDVTATPDGKTGEHSGPGVYTLPKPKHPARGGYITGPGTGTSDSIPAWISNGEYVVNARATAKHRAQLEAINKGYAAGGYVGGGRSSGSSGGSMKVQGELKISADSQGQLRAWMQGIVLDEDDHAATIQRMRVGG